MWRTALRLTLVARVGLSSSAIQSRERSSCGARSYSCGPICTSTGASRCSCANVHEAAVNFDTITLLNFNRRSSRTPAR